MRLASIHPGDIVRCDIRGVRFLAEVTDCASRGLQVEPLCKGISYRRATARQVVTHWRRSKARS